MTPKEKALKLCQQFGVTTLFSKANSGHTLPLDIAKKCAQIACDTHLGYSENDSPFATMKDWQENNQYWQSVKKEIENL